jgi:adenylate cyclase
MSHEPIQLEIEKIRGARIPIASLARETADEMPIRTDFDELTCSDIEKLQSLARGFCRDIDSFFPDDLDLPADQQNDFLRKSKHDARNRLNQLFNLVQLLRIGNDCDRLTDHLDPLSECLDRCLAALDGAKPGSTDNPEPPPPPPCALTPHPHPGVILIADDNAENRELLGRLLETTGHELHFAQDGVEAIDQIKQTEFDAVLLDIQMPKMDGFEVLANLRESGQLRQTPVIVVTGLQGEQDAVKCIEIGAEDFLSRPIRPALLMARLNASLEKKRLREQVFEQHFTPELARELARNPDPMKMQARHEEVSLLFCDIRGFSSISERLGPAQTVDWLSGVMGEFSSIVIELGGVLVDYTGDELLAMWGAPNHQPDHARLACRAALEMMESLEDLNQYWQPKVEAETCVGIGINTGEALVGNIGTHRKFKYGPLGTTVNLASRVQGATKYLKTSLLITGNTTAKLGDDFRTRRLCQVKVRNIMEPVDLYELAPNQVDQEWTRQARQYEKALGLFEKNRLRDSSAILSDVLVETPHDGPCLQLMSRVVESMIQDLPESEFSPVWELPGK